MFICRSTERSARTVLHWAHSLAIGISQLALAIELFAVENLQKI